LAPPIPPRPSHLLRVAAADSPRRGSDPVLLTTTNTSKPSDLATANSLARWLSATPPSKAASPTNPRTSSPALKEPYTRNGAPLATSVISYGSDTASTQARGGSPLNNSNGDNAISRLRTLLSNPPSLHTQQPPQQPLEEKPKLERQSDKPVDSEIARRESKILEMIHEQRKRLELEAAEEASRQENEWQEQGINALPWNN
jgi:hypothetical protein